MNYIRSIDINNYVIKPNIFIKNTMFESDDKLKEFLMDLEASEEQFFEEYKSSDE